VGVHRVSNLIRANSAQKLRATFDKKRQHFDRQNPRSEPIRRRVIPA